MRREQPAGSSGTRSVGEVRAQVLVKGLLTGLEAAVADHNLVSDAHSFSPPEKICTKNRKTFRTSRKIEAASKGAELMSAELRSRWKSNMVKPAKIIKHRAGESAFGCPPHYGRLGLASIPGRRAVEVRRIPGQSRQPFVTGRVPATERIVSAGSRSLRQRRPLPVPDLATSSWAYLVVGTRIQRS